MAVLSGFMVLALVCAFSLCAAAAADLDPALLPLPALAVAVALLAVAGCLNVLPLGLWLALGGLLLGAVYGGVRAGIGAIRRAAGSPAFWLFAVCSLFFWTLFAIRQPMFTQWDEFTAWGAAPRLVKVMDALYVARPYSLTASHTFPGTSLLSYLFLAFSPVFGEWQCFAALDTLLMACVAAAAAARPGRGWPQSVAVFACGALLPLLFNIAPAGTASTVYQAAMADVPLGFVFGGVLCLYYGGRQRGRGVGLLLAALPLGLLALLKDIAFAYGLIAAFVLAVDVLFCVPAPAVGLHARTPRPAAALGRAAAAFVLAAVPVLAAFAGWNRYTALADPQTAGGSVGGAGLSYGAVLLGGVRQLLGIAREEKFSRLLALMGRAFLARPVFLAGAGVLVVLLAVVLAQLAAWGRPRAEAASRRRPIIACLALALCFAALYAFHLILYHYNFAEQEALELKDYARYLSPYYIGWLLAQLCLLGQSAASAGPGGLRAGRALAVGTVALAALIAWRGIPTAGFWTDAGSVYTLRLDVQQRAAVMNTVLDWPDRVLVFSQGDDGTRWYYYKYELTATVANGWTLDPVTGQRRHGDFIELREDGEGSAERDRRDLIEHMEENDIAYLLVDRSDRYLADILAPATQGTPRDDDPPTLYRFERGSERCFIPVATAEREVAP